ncbi:MAG: hypothetical protein KJT03_09835 [Verrucomicrobiae bacterium]|nr:hypothetical protein [Verrucomicrobiae bacterium]
MKKLSITLVFITLLSLPLSAAIITVDNNPGSVAMFTDTAAAYNSAATDDIILVAGSTSNYSNINSYKRLTWIGVGYFLGPNGIPGLNTNPAKFNITFKNDSTNGNSSGSTYIGIQGAINSDASANNLTIDKCRSGGFNWRFDGSVTITRCYIENVVQLFAANSSISNCIVSDLRLEVANTTADYCNVVSKVSNVASSSISNTIFQVTNAGNWDGNASFSYCLNIGAGFLPDGGGNINNVLLAQVLVASGSSDGYYQLSEGSLAAGAGLNMSDMGAFGGSSPYVLSGVPGIPRITRFSVPSTATGLTALEFEVEAESFAE